MAAGQLDRTVRARWNVRRPAPRAVGAKQTTEWITPLETAVSLLLFAYGLAPHKEHGVLYRAAKIIDLIPHVTEASIGAQTSEVLHDGLARAADGEGRARTGRTASRWEEGASHELAAAGLSSRAIASAVRVSKRQVSPDAAAGGESPPTSTTGTDGRTDARAQPADGDRCQRPLPAAFRDLVSEIGHRPASPRRLHEDNRFAAKREGREGLRPRLSRLHDELMAFSWALDPHSGRIDRKAK